MTERAKEQRNSRGPARDLRGIVTATTPDGFKPPPDLHQPRRKRRATIVQVCPSSPEQRARWATAAAERGESLSAFLAAAADARAAAP